jgi:hypothetical protein
MQGANMKMLRGFMIGSLLLVVTGCGGGSKPKDLIVGKWKGSEMKGGKEITAVEFTKDGAFKMNVMGMSVDGKYKFVDDNNFEMSVAGQTNKLKIESITKEKMVTTDQDGKQEYTRIQ